MTKDEVVEDLQHIQQLLHLLERSRQIIDASIYDEPIEEAIRCVELVPELIETLEYAHAKLEEHWYGKDIDDMQKLIKKAKGAE